MSTPNMEFVSTEILQQLSKIKPCVLVVLTKGDKYDDPDTRRIIQSEHLPYTLHSGTKESWW
jgi:hypothetical protein